MPQPICPVCKKPWVRTDEEGQVHYAICVRCPFRQVVNVSTDTHKSGQTSRSDKQTSNQTTEV